MNPYNKVGALAQRLSITLLLVMSLPVAAQQLPGSIAELDAALDDALAEVRPDYEDRLVLVEHVKRVASTMQDPPITFIQKARFVAAMANMRLGNFKLSEQQLDILCPQIEVKSSPELRFRCDALAAILLLIRGDRAASLAAFETLFDADISAISEGLKARTQVSYAAVLNENGRAAQAADIYEQLILNAVTEQDDALALFAGNNLTVILITQSDYVAARQTLDELKPIIARNPDSLVYGSLQLHDYELTRIEGAPAEAIVGLQAFIDNEVDTTPLMMGSAHKLLADALRDVGRLEEALAHARTALEMLDSQAHEVNDARLALAKILVEQEEYAAAIKEIEGIDIEMEAVPARRVMVHRLLLESKLRRENRVADIATFSALIAADSERDLLASTTRSEYFDARLTAARRGLELEKAEAMTIAQAEQNQIERRNLLLLFGLIGAAAIALCLVIYLQVSRRNEQRLLEEKQAQNEKLEVLVAEKTRELTDNLNARAEMARALERTKRNEAIGLLAGNVAHDFNNLLQVIAGSNEILAKPSITGNEKSEVLKLSEKSLLHASRIISQLLAYSRQQDLAPHALRFSHYLSDTQALLHTALGEHNEFRVDDASDGANILVDAAQLTTAILNLISNAADAMPAGGRVTLAAEVCSLDAGQAQQWNDIDAGEFLIISVADNGIGMTGKQLAQAYEPFFTTKDAQSGTGLGLSSVYGFVKQSGGDLKIHSKIEEGTKVEFLLPITQQVETAHSPSDVNQALQLAGQRVLLVEDNDSVACMLESLFRRLKIHTERVGSGQAAQERLLEGASFNYVLTDVRMPGSIDGPALARWIRAEVPEVTVLLMSGFSELGPDNQDLPLIRKPFGLSQLSQFMSENMPQ